MKLCQGDIVWVSFPFSDGINFKKRPALVLSNDYYNEEYNDLLLAYITSRERKEFELKISKEDLTEGELMTSSFVRYDKILLVQKERIHGVIAIVSKQFYQRVVLKITEFIGYDQ